MQKMRLIALTSALLLGTSSHTFFASNVVRASSEEEKVYDYNNIKLNIPEHYYDGLNDSLTYNDFQNKLGEIISKDNKLLDYSSVGYTLLHYSDMDPENPNNTICIYSGQSLRGGWNREHIWCKSHGFMGKTTYDPYRDAHHLRVINATINSKRNNSDYGEVDHSTSFKDLFGNFYTNTVYEPRDEVKGDCARMIFYIATRYKNVEPYNASIIEGSSLSYITDYGKAVFGNLSTLLKWHYMDPVSIDEIYRNNVIYSYQNNRNPFIDHPEYVEKCYNVSKIPGYKVETSINNEKLDEFYDYASGIKSDVNKITSDDSSYVMSTYEKYSKELNNNEKSSISNDVFNRMVNAVKKIRELKLSRENDEFHHTTYFETVQYRNPLTGGISKYTTAKYYEDQTIPYPNGDIYFSNMHFDKSCNTYQISLGNKTSTPIDKSKFKFARNDYGDYFLCDYVTNDITSIDMYTPAPKRDISLFRGYSIFIEKLDGTYQELKYSPSYQDHFKYEPHEKVSGKIGIMIYGPATAICVQSITVSTNKVDRCEQEIKGMETKANLYFAKDFSHIEMNFALLMPYERIEHLKEKHLLSSYGVIIKEYTNEDDSLTNLLESNKTLFGDDNKLFAALSNKCDVTHIEKGNNDTLRFYPNFYNDSCFIYKATIELSKASLDKKYEAVSFITMDGLFIPFSVKTESFNSLFSKYQNVSASTIEMVNELNK